MRLKKKIKYLDKAINSGKLKFSYQGTKTHLSLNFDEYGYDIHLEDNAIVTVTIRMAMPIGDNIEIAYFYLPLIKNKSLGHIIAWLRATSEPFYLTWKDQDKALKTIHPLSHRIRKLWYRLF